MKTDTEGVEMAESPRETKQHPCPKCGSTRWKATSVDHGWTRRAQCLKCDELHAFLGMGNQPATSPRGVRTQMRYRKRSSARKTNE